MNKRLIFTVTTGRSGTYYLSRLIDTSFEALSFHEPDPAFQSVMREVQHDPSVAYRFWTEQKLPHIHSLEGDIYVETSHVFSKGFLQPLLNTGIVPDLFLLIRDKREVARSLYQIDTIPARTQLGNTWLLCPDDPDVVTIPDWQQLSDYQLCYWYCLETERRQHLHEQHVLSLGGKVLRVTFPQLISDHAVEWIAEGMNLPRRKVLNMESLRDQTNAMIPQKVHYAKVIPHEWELLEMEARVDALWANALDSVASKVLGSAASKALDKFAK